MARRRRHAKEIERINPEDVEGYKKLLAHSEQIFDVGFSQLAHVPFNKFWFMLKQVPDLIGSVAIEPFGNSPNASQRRKAAQSI